VLHVWHEGGDILTLCFFNFHSNQPNDIVIMPISMEARPKAMFTVFSGDTSRAPKSSMVTRLWVACNRIGLMDLIVG
jgi:hypothetical protein